MLKYLQCPTWIHGSYPKTGPTIFLYIKHRQNSPAANSAAGQSIKFQAPHHLCLCFAHKPNAIKCTPNSPSMPSNRTMQINRMHYLILINQASSNIIKHRQIESNARQNTVCNKSIITAINKEAATLSKKSPAANSATGQ